MIHIVALLATDIFCIFFHIPIFDRIPVSEANLYWFYLISIFNQYLGNKTSEKVKKKCIELMYSWSRGLPHENKVLEAYKMLKQQGIVKEDPDYIDKVINWKLSCLLNLKCGILNFGFALTYRGWLWIWTDIFFIFYKLGVKGSRIIVL